MGHRLSSRSDDDTSAICFYHVSMIRASSCFIMLIIDPESVLWRPSTAYTVPIPIHTHTAYAIHCIRDTWGWRAGDGDGGWYDPFRRPGAAPRPQTDARRLVAMRGLLAGRRSICREAANLRGNMSLHHFPPRARFAVLPCAVNFPTRGAAAFGIAIRGSARSMAAPRLRHPAAAALAISLAAGPISAMTSVCVAVDSRRARITHPPPAHAQCVSSPRITSSSALANGACDWMSLLSKGAP